MVFLKGANLKMYINPAPLLSNESKYFTCKFREKDLKTCRGRWFFNLFVITKYDSGRYRSKDFCRLESQQPYVNIYLFYIVTINKVHI